MFGYMQKELLGQNVSMLMSKPFRDEYDSYFADYLKAGDTQFIGLGREISGRRKNGSNFPVDLAISRVEHFDQFTSIIRDISTRKQLQTQVLKIAEEEQRRIGQELHDGTGQELTGLALFAGSIEKLLNEMPRKTSDDEASWIFDEESLMELRQAAQRLSNGLSETNRRIQKLSHGIMPVQVEPEGLRAALEQLASATDALQTITCSFNCPHTIAVANNTVATHLYRIAQEAVHNAMRHSQATHIGISLLLENNEILLEVSDNGVGFELPTNQSAARGIPDGFGLQIMNYRASIIGGSFRISRHDHAGTLVRCTVPSETNHES